MLDEVGKLDPENPSLARAARQGERRARLRVAAGIAACRGEAVAAARAPRGPVLEQGAARRRLVRRGDVELPRRARAVARAARPQPARLRGAGVAARGAVRVRAARRRQAGRGSLRRRDRRVQRRDRAAHDLDRGDRARRADHGAARRARRRGRRAVRLVSGASSSVPDTIESRYLYELMASNNFQEGLKNYRDLAVSRIAISSGGPRASARSTTSSTRASARTSSGCPKIDESLSSVDLDAMLARRVELESRLQAIERSEDVVALGTQKEQQRLAQADARWSRCSRGCRTMRRPTRFARSSVSSRACSRGTCARDYKARLWAEKKSLGDLDRQLREAQRRHHQVSERARRLAREVRGAHGAHRRLAAARGRDAGRSRRRRSRSSRRSSRTSPSPSSRRSATGSTPTWSRRASRSRRSTTARPRGATPRRRAQALAEGAR